MKQVKLTAQWVVNHYNYLSELASMQDPNLYTYCSKTYTPTASATEISFSKVFNGDLVPRATLKDIRDNNKYLVSKLADGNCWMSQSLALDLSTSKALTNSDTDLNTKTSWTPNNTTQTTTGTKWAQADNNARSYHPQASESYYRAGITKSSSPTGSGDEYLGKSQEITITGMQRQQGADLLR